jgi:hypothetical protein
MHASRKRLNDALCCQFAPCDALWFQKAFNRPIFPLFLEHERGNSTTGYGSSRRQVIVLVTAYKIPDPTRRDELLEQRQWALIRLEQVKQRRVGPETVKMQALIQRCDVELEEMTLIEHYRKDESYEPTLNIDPRS